MTYDLNYNIFMILNMYISKNMTTVPFNISQRGAFLCVANWMQMNVSTSVIFIKSPNQQAELK